MGKALAGTCREIQGGEVMCVCCDGILHPDQLVAVCKRGGIVRMVVMNTDRKEVIYIDNVANYCPQCGRKLKET